MFVLNLNAIPSECVLCNELVIDGIHGFFGNAKICNVLSMALGHEKIEADTAFLDPMCRTCLKIINKLIEEQHRIYVKMTKIRQMHYVRIGDARQSKKLKNILNELQLRTIDEPVKKSEKYICKSPIDIIDVSDDHEYNIDQNDEPGYIVDLSSCRSSPEPLDSKSNIIVINSSISSVSSTYSVSSSSVDFLNASSEQSSIAQTSVQPQNIPIRCKTCSKVFQVKNDLSWHVAECEAIKFTLDSVSIGISDENWMLRPRTRSQCREYERSTALRQQLLTPSARSDRGPMPPRRSSLRLELKRRAFTDASSSTFYKSKIMLQTPSFSAAINIMPNRSRKR